jgi:hypothetical protein
VHREIHSIKCIHYQEPEKEEQVKFNEEKGKQGRSEKSIKLKNKKNTNETKN